MMHAKPLPAGRVRWRAAAMIVAFDFAILATAGCTTHFGTPGLSTPEAPMPPPNPTDGQIANLRSIGGSALTGRIRVIDRGDDATILVSMINVPAGAYRIVLHETPNCTSPNGFSAGAAWAPPASGKRPLDLVPTQYTNSEAMVETELRIAGLRSNGANGVAGHSVVVYAGSNVTEIRPDVPNAAIACGVFAPVQRLTF